MVAFTCAASVDVERILSETDLVAKKKHVSYNEVRKLQASISGLLIRNAMQARVVGR